MKEFASLVARRVLKTKCPACHKRLTRVVKQRVLHNGVFLSNEDVQAEICANVDREYERLKASGVWCVNCSRGMMGD